MNGRRRIDVIAAAVVVLIGSGVGAAADPLCPACTTHEVAPHVAAGGQAAAFHPDDPSIALVDRAPAGTAGRGLLLVFLSGSGATLAPASYRNVGRVAAHAGYHVILLDAWNLHELRAMCAGTTPKTDCWGALRHQVFDGTLPGPHFHLQGAFAPHDAVEARLNAVLGFLARAHPAEGWGQFLVDPRCAPGACKVAWGKVAIAGHSFGAGEAAFVASQRTVARVVMLSGPVDEDAAWTKASRQHPEKYWALGHACDNAAALPFFQTELGTWQHFGLAGAPVFIERTLASATPSAAGRHACAAEPVREASVRPFGRSHRLVSGMDNGCVVQPPALEFHNEVAVDCAHEPTALVDAWRYLLTQPAAPAAGPDRCTQACETMQTRCIAHAAGSGQKQGCVAQLRLCLAGCASPDHAP